MKRILVVDDERDIVESLEVMLARSGFEVVTAANGSEAWAAVQRDRPDLVLSDVMMPVMDGLELCRRIKSAEETKSLPVLLVTALHQTADKVKGLEAGADDFVTKPFNDVELRARINAFLRTKSLRDELEESYRKLRELERQRDALSGMIVHDLKVPLASVKGGLDVCLDYLDGDANAPAEIKKIVANAHASVKRVVGLIQDILDVSRMEEAGLPLKKKETDLIALAHDVVRAVTPLAASAKVSVVEKLSPGPLRANVDASIIERVVTNLMSNSLKFTDAGGTVSIEAKALPKEKQVELAVSDTGIGIPKEHLEKIFDKFFQSGGHEMSRKGQGLGLAFCRLAIEAHDGKIWAESETGRGSRFVIRLPL